MFEVGVWMHSNLYNFIMYVYVYIQTVHVYIQQPDNLSLRHCNDSTNLCLLIVKAMHILYPWQCNCVQLLWYLWSYIELLDLCSSLGATDLCVIEFVMEWVNILGLLCVYCFSQVSPMHMYWEYCSSQWDLHDWWRWPNHTPRGYSLITSRELLSIVG